MWPATEELKVGSFKPEYAGKLNFYLSAADDLLRTAPDAPTLGLLLCESRGGSVVEYALRDVAKPIGVATYRVTRQPPEPLRAEIPSIEDLKEVVGKLRPELKSLKGEHELLRSDAAVTGAIPGNVTLFSAVTVTGTSLLWACWPKPSVPLRYSYRHWNTWFAFTPCSRATRAIEAPGTNVASTIRRFSSGVLRNRLREGATDSTATVSLTRSSWDRSGHLSIWSGHLSIR
jgi:hypothetical protein